MRAGNRWNPDQPVTRRALASLRLGCGDVDLHSVRPRLAGDRQQVGGGESAEPARCVALGNELVAIDLWVTVRQPVRSIANAIRRILCATATIARRAPRRIARPFFSGPNCVCLVRAAACVISHRMRRR